MSISVKDKIHANDEAPASWLLLVYEAEYAPSPLMVVGREGGGGGGDDKTAVPMLYEVE